MRQTEKVFKKMGFVIVKEDIDGAINAERGAVERILKFVRQKVTKIYFMSTLRTHRLCSFAQFAEFQTRVPGITFFQLD